MPEDDQPLFHALADPTRRLILDELAERNDLSLFELCARLATKHGVTSSRQAVTQHLDVLEQAGLVRSAKVGRTRIHHLHTGPLAAIAARWPPDAEDGPTSPPPRAYRRTSHPDR